VLEWFKRVDDAVSLACEARDRIAGAEWSCGAVMWGGVGKYQGPV